MRKIALKLYRFLIPLNIRITIKERQCRRIILNYFNNNSNLMSEEEKEVINYIKKNNLKVYPYEFLDKYDSFPVEVLFDASVGLCFVIYQDKKLYYPKNWSKRSIVEMHRELIKEQDIRSPHKYIDENFKVENGDIVLDVGAAEGIFALSVVEIASKVILFEPDRNWNNALEATFAPWNDKVKIINKLVDEVTSEKTITLDDSIELSNNQSAFIKIDVEGYEKSVINGSQKIIKSGAKLNFAVCTYHKQKDAEELGFILNQYGFNTHLTSGFMIRYYDSEFTQPFLRRGVIRGHLK